MLKKTFVTLLLSMVLTFSFTVLISAEELVEAHVHEINCVESQFERLRELLRGDIVASFPYDNIPIVNFIAPPEEHREYFIIGVMYEPTQECIDFILAYTGIAKENARISQATLERQVLPYCPDELQALLRPSLEHSQNTIDINTNKGKIMLSVKKILF